MDSMRQLSTSLPRRRHDQPQDLLSDFKSAALSVTNLYKTAASAHLKARAAGYQDALDDLLAMLDKEDLGLMDGEGWKVRRWATERLDGEAARAPKRDSSSDDEGKEEPERAGTRSSSPEAQRKPNIPSSEAAGPPHSSLQKDAAMVSDPPTAQGPPQAQHQQPQHQRSQPQQPVHQPPASRPHPTPPTRSTFSFRSTTHTYPSPPDRLEPAAQQSTMEIDRSSSSPAANGSGGGSTTGTTTTTEPIRIAPRSTRTGRPNRHRGENRTVNFNLTGGSAAAAAAAAGKRKMPYPDFFDISGVTFDGAERREGRDGGRGGKRGRHV